MATAKKEAYRLIVDVVCKREELGEGDEDSRKLIWMMRR